MSEKDADDDIPEFTWDVVGTITRNVWESNSINVTQNILNLDRQHTVQS